MDTVTVASLMTSAGEIFSGAIGFVSEVAGTIVENPMLLLYSMLPLCGIGIGFFKRLINVN